MPKVRMPNGLSQRNISSTRKYTCSRATSTTKISAASLISLSPRLLQPRVEPVDVRLHLRGAALVHDLAPHDLAGVGETVARGGQRALHAVHALAQHHLDRLRALAEHHDLE